MRRCCPRDLARCPRPLTREIRRRPRRVRRAVHRSFLLRNSPIVSLSSLATFGNLRLALGCSAPFALCIRAGTCTDYFCLLDDRISHTAFRPYPHDPAPLHPYPTIQRHPILRSTSGPPDGGRTGTSFKRKSRKVILAKLHFRFHHVFLAVFGSNILSCGENCTCVVIKRPRMATLW